MLAAPPAGRKVPYKLYPDEFYGATREICPEGGARGPRGSLSLSWNLERFKFQPAKETTHFYKWFRQNFICWPKHHNKWVLSVKVSADVVFNSQQRGGKQTGRCWLTKRDRMRSWSPACQGARHLIMLLQIQHRCFLRCWGVSLWTSDGLTEFTVFSYVS